MANTRHTQDQVRKFSTEEIREAIKRKNRSVLDQLTLNQLQEALAEAEKSEYKKVQPPRYVEK